MLDAIAGTREQIEQITGHDELSKFSTTVPYCTALGELTMQHCKVQYWKPRGFQDPLTTRHNHTKPVSMEYYRLKNRRPSGYRKRTVLYRLLWVSILYRLRVGTISGDELKARALRSVGFA